MLKITELRNAMEAAALALDAAMEADAPRATERKLEKAATTARTAYYAEFDKARELQAQYEAMPDDDANGSTNAGDTFPHSDHGNERFNSTEYWRCAIDSAQMMNDEAAATAKREADRAAMRAEEAAAAAALEVAEAAPVEVGYNGASAFHVGDDAYTVQLSIGGGQLAYHVGPRAFPYFTKEEAEAVAEKVSASGVITPADWTDGYGRPLVASMVAPRPALALA
jgi:hypothetical protein